MKACELCPSPHLSAEDLEGDTEFVIDHVGFAEVGEAKENKGVIYFRGQKRGMVINKTNCTRIVEMFGNETDDWVGETITLYPSEADFGGKTVPCIRVRPLEHQRSTKTKSKRKRKASAKE